jgi:hypothetical protein
MTTQKSASQATNSEPNLSDYRKLLVSAEQASQEQFDKTVLSLSGGALGISFVFLKDVIGSSPVLKPSLLIASWIAWALSSFAVLASFYLSHLALRRAIKQVDDGTIYNHRAGGPFSIITAILNASGAILFFVGVCSITAFSSANLSTRGSQDAPKRAAISTAAPAVPTTPAAPAAATKASREAGQAP